MLPLVARLGGSLMAWAISHGSTSHQVRRFARRAFVFLDLKLIVSQQLPCTTLPERKRPGMIPGLQTQSNAAWLCKSHTFHRLIARTHLPSVTTSRCGSSAKRAFSLKDWKRTLPVYTTERIPTFIFSLDFSLTTIASYSKLNHAAWLTFSIIEYSLLSYFPFLCF